jgi:hypothetical protein
MPRSCSAQRIAYCIDEAFAGSISVVGKKSTHGDRFITFGRLSEQLSRQSPGLT